MGSASVLVPDFALGSGPGSGPGSGLGFGLGLDPGPDPVLDPDSGLVRGPAWSVCPVRSMIPAT